MIFYSILNSVEQEHAIHGLELSRLDEPRMRYPHGIERTVKLLCPEREKIVQRGKFREQIVILPDVGLKDRTMIRHPIEDLGSGESVAQNLFAKVVRNRLCPHRALPDCDPKAYVQG